MKWARPMVILMALLQAGCGDDEPPEKKVSFELRPIPSFESPLWTGEVDADDPVVASVEGTPITVSMLQAQVDRAGEGADPAEVLERMIEFELLAREAFNSGKYTLDVVGKELRRALARTMVMEAFERQLDSDAIPDNYMDMAYKHMKGRFDHFERFLIAEVQILCCTDENPDACYMDLFDEVEDRRAHHKTCFEYHEAEAQKMAELLSTATDKADFKRKFDAASTYLPNRDLAVQYHTAAHHSLYDFQYDVDSTYEAQFETIKYRVFYKEIMEGAKKAWMDNGEQTPVVTGSIRTPLGYHILFIYEVQREKHWPVSHPEVQKEIRANIYDKWRTVYFRETLEKLCRSYGCDVDPKRLVPLQQLQEERGQ